MSFCNKFFFIRFYLLSDCWMNMVLIYMKRNVCKLMLNHPKKEQIWKKLIA